MMRKFQGPLEMFWLWVQGRGLAHMLSELMREPRLDDAGIAVLVLDFELVSRSTRAIRCTFPTAAEISSPTTQLTTVALLNHIKTATGDVSDLPSFSTARPKRHQTSNPTPKNENKKKPCLKKQLTQKVVSLMILRPPRNLNTLQAIIDSALPALQLQPSIRAVREKQRVAGKPLAGLRVEFFGGCVVAFFESFVALLFESVGGCLGHGAGYGG
jgi:hypothetical protein